MDVTFASVFGAGLLLFALFVLALIVAKFYRRVEQGKALIVGKKKGPDVTFTGAVVLPIIHKAEVMDISVKTIEIDRRGKEGLICRDNIRADIKVTFFVRVNKTVEDVIKVAQSIGCIRASDRQTLEELFSAKFSEGLKTIGKQLDFVDLYTKRNEFRDAIIELIGRDLNGYVLEDAAIDYLEQTPLANLDPKNILDAQGIRKITELTAAQHVQTNQFENQEKKQIRKQDVEAGEAILELNRQYADAEAKQQREIESVRAREAAELGKIQAEERLRSENARIKTDEELAIAEENKKRQVEVAEKNRQRVIGVETERVEKDRALEQVMRERAVELSQIEKEKALEVERKNIQDVIRERVAVERTVVEEEERIKTVRVVEDAKRAQEAIVIAAEAEAQEQLVKRIKQAESMEIAARHQAKEKITLAEAELESSDRVARAKIRLAEGVQAETAAPGLAAARVKEAEAMATEKFGTAEANVHRQKALADAQGIEQKAAALKELDVASREHEEFRLRIENERLLGVESIRARQAVEEAKAEILGAALTTANIDIVGGDGAFVDRLVNSIGMGKAVDQFLAQSDNAAALASKITDGLLPVMRDKEPVVVPDDAKKLKVKQQTAD